MAKLKPEIKRLWLEALRGGEYKQGRARLCTAQEGGDAFCCLGVLTDIAVKQGLGAWSEPDSRGARAWLLDAQEKAEAVLSSPVIEWAFDVPDAHYPESPEVFVRATQSCHSLAMLNDHGLSESGSLSFQGIADLIEEHY